MQSMIIIYYCRTLLNLSNNLNFISCILWLGNRYQNNNYTEMYEKFVTQNKYFFGFSLLNILNFKIEIVM